MGWRHGSSVLEEHSLLIFQQNSLCVNWKAYNGGMIYFFLLLYILKNTLQYSLQAYERL